MKKILLLVLAVSMMFTLTGLNPVKAVDKDEVYQEELSEAIVSGDGSDENPYVVDYDKAPEFKKYMDKINEEVLSSIGDVTEDDSDASTASLYSGILKGTKHTGQTKGGYWIYKSGCPSVSSNGNICMKKIEYISIANTKNICKLKESSWAWGIVIDYAEDLAKKGIEAGIALLVSKKIGKEAAKSFLTACGKASGSGLFTAADVLIFISDLFTISRYQDAVANKDGMIIATYNTSYQGKWYAQKGEDTWTSAPIAYEPSNAFGKGTYTSH